jgi:TolB-like protein/Flp pilus assembly protein TadD
MSDANKAVFLSYAREDTDAARRIADALRGFGVEVWFDQNELRGGDTWDQKIRNQIRTCTLFMPVVSARTQERAEGYFRREWKIAVERTHDMADGIPFIVPVVIDATAESAALVPEQFMRVQWTRLAGGLPTPEFVVQVKSLLTPSRRAGGVTGGAPAPADPAKSSRTSPLLAVTAVAVIAIGAAVYFALRPAPKAPATAAPMASAPVAGAKPAAEGLTPPAISNKSIAVLPLDNMSDDKDTGFFADGVHEDLLTNLALVPELKVISRTSVMQYRNTKKTIKEIGEELGVAYVLEGSVRRAGNKVRVTGQLINTRTDEHVWAESYDRDLTDIFSIQAELSKKIAGALSIAISPETKKFLERKPTENPVAYDFYLQGRDLRNRSASGSAPQLKEAELLFANAVQQDPKFAAAWGELAGVHALHAFWGIDGSPERLAQGDAAIARAEQLAPDTPDVIRSVGTYAYYAHRDYAKATAQYEKISRLQPNDPTAFYSLGLIQRRQGRWAESLPNLRRAVALDPTNAGYVRGLFQSLYSCRRWDDARAAQQRLVELLPGNLRERLMLAELDFDATGSPRGCDEFLAQLSPAERAAPVAIFFRKAWALNRGDYAEFTRLDQLQPNFEEEESKALSGVIAAGVYQVTGDTTAFRNRLAPALAECRAKVKQEPANIVASANLAQLEVLAGNAKEGLRIALQCATLLPLDRDAVDGPTYQLVLAVVYAATGDKDHAIATLTELLRHPSNFSVSNLRTITPFKSLEGDPRYEALLNNPKNNAPLF